MGEPARDSGVPVASDVECAGLIASMLAPTVSLQWTQNLRAATFPCGSWFASDGGVSVAGDVGWAGLIASRLAPTVNLSGHKFRARHQSPVGAGLPAMAVSSVTNRRKAGTTAISWRSTPILQQFTFIPEQYQFTGRLVFRHLQYHFIVLLAGAEAQFDLVKALIATAG